MIIYFLQYRGVVREGAMGASTPIETQHWVQRNSPQYDKKHLFFIDKINFYELMKVVSVAFPLSVPLLTET